ncbi:MAG: phosphopantetheine-binding protein [Acidobacteriota bacterium]
MTDPTSRDARRDQLVRFLASIQRPARPVAELGDDEHLIDSGVLDSMAILQVVMHLEQVHGVDLLARGVDPASLTSIGAILDVIEG